MDPNTGRYVELDATIPPDLARSLAARRLAIDALDVVEVTGQPAAVELLARRVALGDAEQEARRARRKAQRAARRRNR